VISDQRRKKRWRWPIVIPITHNGSRAQRNDSGSDILKILRRPCSYNEKSKKFFMEISGKIMSHPIRVRVCLVVVEDDKILLAPHYQTDARPVQWTVTGGMVEFGESIKEAARREFYEETGYNARIAGLLGISEVILPEKSYHSVTIAFTGRITGGDLKPEAEHPYGEKIPRWMSAADLAGRKYHPEAIVEKALGIKK
jgi:8-oxo-dGTP diphosphatase